MLIYLLILFLMIRRPPRSTRTDTLFPYTTLFRSPRLHIQRVHAHRAVDIVITFGQGLDVGRVVRADTDTQKVPYPTLPGSLQGSIQGADRKSTRLNSSH